MESLGTKEGHTNIYKSRQRQDQTGNLVVRKERSYSCAKHARLHIRVVDNIIFYFYGLYADKPCRMLDEHK